MKFTAVIPGQEKSKQTKYRNAREEQELSFPNIPNPETRAHVESVVGNNPARALFRGATQAAAGALGGSASLVGLAESGVNAAQKLVSGRNIPGHEQIQKYIPTSHNIVKGIESATGMELGGSPETENALDRFISNTASFTAPNKLLGGVGKLVGFTNLGRGIPLAKAAKIAGAGQLARSATKFSVGGEVFPIAAELGASLWAGRGSEKISSKLDNAKSNAYAAALSDTKALKKIGNAADIKATVDEALKPFEAIKPGSTIVTEADNLTKGYFQAIGNSIKNGKLSVAKAIDHKKRLNNVLKGWSKNYSIPEEAKNKIIRTVGELNGFIENNTKASHPEFWNNWNVAESIARGQAPLPKEAQNLAKEVAGEIAKKGLGGALGGIIGGGWGILAGGIASQALQMAVKKSKQFKQLIDKSPMAKEMYFELLGDLAMTNIPQAEKNIARLNDLAKKTESPHGMKFKVVKS